jgi:hypothetical protein
MLYLEKPRKSDFVKIEIDPDLGCLGVFASNYVIKLIIN